MMLRMRSLTVDLEEQDITLNDKNVPFEQKIMSITEIWNTIVNMNLPHCELKHLVHVVDWAILHTLNLVLNAEWDRWHETYEVNLLNEIEHARILLVQRSYGFKSRVEKMTYVVKNPWSNPVLMKVMRMNKVEIKQDVIELFCFEETHLVSVRLNKLCESCCEDLALNLVRAYFGTYESVENGSCTLNATQDQISFIFDIRLVLLYKFKQRQELQRIIEELNCQECLIVVRRFAHKRVDFLRIWKYSFEVAELTLQLRINKCVFEYDETKNEDLDVLMETYLDICSHDNLSHRVLRYLQYISLYVNSPVIYKMCEMIHRKYGSSFKSLKIELFIRGLTHDLNGLEEEKLHLENANHLARSLSSKFGLLAAFLGEHVEVARECLLTAFSLDPTKECLTKIEDMARKSGFQVSEEEHLWKCKLHPPALPSDEITWKCPECQEWMCKPVSDIPLHTNVSLNRAINYTNLELPENLCDDLIICISNPRYHILNWSLPWDVLHRLCIMYFKDSNAMKNFVTDLKFLDIDYSLFENIKREPLDDYPGIEKGFEIYLNNDYYPTENNIHPDGHKENGAPRDEITENILECQEISRESSQEECSRVKISYEENDVPAKTSESQSVIVDEKKRSSRKRIIVSEYGTDDLENPQKHSKSKDLIEKPPSAAKSLGEIAANNNLKIQDDDKKNHSLSDNYVIPAKWNRDKKRRMQKNVCNDENYDPNSLESLKKYLKSKKLKKEISSTRKYYRKSFETKKARYVETHSETDNQEVLKKSETKQKNITEAEKNIVVDKVEECLQNYIDGEEYDPNSIESLKKCVDLEKSREKLLSDLRKKSASSQIVLRSDSLLRVLPRSVDSYKNMKNTRTRAFGSDCWNCDNATKNSYEFLNRSRYLTTN